MEKQSLAVKDIFVEHVGKLELAIILKGDAFTDKNGLNYYLRSEKMAENLPKRFNLTFSKTTKNPSLNAFNNIKGIYFIQPISPKEGAQNART